MLDNQAIEMFARKGLVTMQSLIKILLFMLFMGVVYIILIILVSLDETSITHLFEAQTVDHSGVLSSLTGAYIEANFLAAIGIATFLYGTLGSLGYWRHSTLGLIIALISGLVLVFVAWNWINVSAQGAAIVLPAKNPFADSPYEQFPYDRVGTLLAIRDMSIIQLTIGPWLSLASLGVLLVRFWHRKTA